MKYKLVFIFSLYFFINEAFAQDKKGDIEMVKSFFGVKYFRYDKEITSKKVMILMKDNDKAYAEFKKAKTNLGVANVFGFIGGALIGWPVGTAIGGGDPQWSLAAAGAGAILLSIPFNSAYVKRAGNAINLYNNGSGTSTGAVSMHLIPYATGATLLVRF